MGYNMTSPPLLPPPPSFSSESLPDDIIGSILMRLPVKSLLRFRCVSKQWNSIITSQTFILNYSDRSRFQRYLFIHFPEYSSTGSQNAQPCSIFSESSLSVVSEFEITSTFGNPSDNSMGFCFIGSCNGLLCITNTKHFGRELYLWNPSIRKYKILTTTSVFTGKFSQKFKHPKTSIIVGLCFDSETKDYKILRIALFRWRSHRSKSKPPPQAEIYSLSTDSWRRVEIPDHLKTRFRTTHSWNYAYINGAFHWLAVFIDEQGMDYLSILMFDGSKERFVELKLPHDYPNDIDCIKQRLFVFKGSLTLINYRDNGEERNVCNMWTMNGSFWRKQRMEFAGLRWYCGCIGDRLVLANRLTEVYLFDPQSMEERAAGTSRLVSVHPFAESLTLL